MATAVCHCFIGYFIMKEESNNQIFAILVFLIINSNTTGPVAWLYATETTIDVAFGICIFTMFGTVIILSLVAPTLMAHESIGTKNVFFIFAFTSFLGGIYSLIFLKETKGLSEKEKKLLYTPEIYKTDE